MVAHTHAAKATTIQDLVNARTQRQVALKLDHYLLSDPLIILSGWRQLKVSSSGSITRRFVESSTDHYIQ